MQRMQNSEQYCTVDATDANFWAVVYMQRTQIFAQAVVHMQCMQISEQ